MSLPGGLASRCLFQCFYRCHQATLTWSWAGASPWVRLSFCRLCCLPDPLWLPSLNHQWSGSRRSLPTLAIGIGSLSSSGSRESDAGGSGVATKWVTSRLSTPEVTLDVRSCTGTQGVSLSLWLLLGLQISCAASTVVSDRIFQRLISEIPEMGQAIPTRGRSNTEKVA